MTDFLAELERLKTAATKPVNSMVTFCDVGTANQELALFLRNHADEIAELVKAADAYANSTPCSDPDCCESAIQHEAKRQSTLSALANLNKEKS